MTLIILVFAEEILTFWVNEELASKGKITLILFALGVLLSSSAWTSLTVANSAGRPDIPAKVHLVMAMVNIILCIFLIPKYGINGAALAWFLQHSLDIFLLTPWVNKSIIRIRNWNFFLQCYLKPVIFGLLVGLLAYVALKPFVTNLVSLGCIIIICGFFHLFGSYYLVLQTEDRILMKKLLLELRSKCLK